MFALILAALTGPTTAASSGGDPFAWPTLIAVIAAGIGAVVAAGVSVYNLVARRVRVKWKVAFTRKLFEGRGIEVQVTNLGRETAFDALGTFRLMNGRNKSTYVRIAHSTKKDIVQGDFATSILSSHDEKDLWAAVDWTWHTTDGRKHERTFKWRPGRHDELFDLTRSGAVARFARKSRRQNTPPRRSILEWIVRRR